MKKVIITGFTFVLMGMSSSAIAAGWVRVGSEYEWYPKVDNPNYHRITSYNPYFRFSYRPLNSDWTFTGRALWKQYPYKKLYPNSTSTSQSALYEMYVTDYIRSGSFIFRPGIGFRIIPYNSNNQYGSRYERQLRILPQFDYLIQPTTRLYLNGFFYVADSLGSRKNDRATDSKGDCAAKDANQSGFCSNKYSDWGYEFDTGIRHNFNPYNLLVLGIHTEYKGVTNNYNDNLIQLLLEYQYTIGKLTLAPYTKISLTRTISNKSERDPSVNVTLKQPYHRYGLRATYPVNGRWTFIGESYFHTEKMQSYNGSKKIIENMDDRNKWFFNFALQYNF